MDKTVEYCHNHLDQTIDELMELLRIPSVSADSSHKQDMYRAAEYLRNRLLQAGVDRADIIETEGHPIVYGEKIIDPSLPTVLVYGHYDVQPPDPLDLWESPPFDPVIKATDIHPEGAIFARGASDDKGQVYMHVKVLEAMNATGELPCNVKCIIEGEEEVGSKHLEPFVRDHRDMLQCDIILISDTGIIDRNTPAITIGLRGLCYMEVEVTGPNRDLHSGLFGGAVANPANELAKMIAQMHDANYRITIPGFYDKVREASEEERRALNNAPFDLEAFKKDIGIRQECGEAGYTTIERIGIRPTLDVNGMWSGYTGEGAKTVLPSRAHAKISMRLVPDQDYREIAELFTNYVRQITPPCVDVEVRFLHGGHPYLMPIDNIGYRAAHRAMAKGFGKEPVPVRGGGSIPIVPLFEQLLGVKTILMGFGLDSDKIHSPNEHFGLYNLQKGLASIPWFYHYYTNLYKETTS